MFIALIVIYTVFPLPEHKEHQQEKGRWTILLPFLLAVAVYVAMRAYSLRGIVGTSIPLDDLFDRLTQNYHIIPQYLGLLL